MLSSKNIPAAAIMGLTGLACSHPAPVAPQTPKALEASEVKQPIDEEASEVSKVKQPIDEKAPEVPKLIGELDASQISHTDQPLPSSMKLYFRDITLGIVANVTEQLKGYDVGKCTVLEGEPVTFTADGAKIKLNETIGCPDIGGIEKVKMGVECDKVVSLVDGEKAQWVDCLDKNAQGQNTVKVTLEGKGGVKRTVQVESKKIIPSVYALAEGKMTGGSKGLVGDLRDEYVKRLEVIAQMVNQDKSPCVGTVESREKIDIDGKSRLHRYENKGVCNGPEGSAIGAFELQDVCTKYTATNLNGVPKYQQCLPGARKVDGYTTTGFDLSLTKYLEKKGSKSGEEEVERTANISPGPEGTENSELPTEEKSQPTKEMVTDCQFKWQGDAIAPNCKNIKNEQIPKGNWHKSSQKGMVVVDINGVSKGEDGAEKVVFCPGITIPKQAPKSNEFAVEGVKCSVKQQTEEKEE